MESSLLYEIVVIFGLSIVILLVCHQVRVPTILGFLLTGVLAGPHGLGLVTARHEVELLAEVGVVLLLFTIGIEFSFKSLLQIKRSFLFGGSLQVGLTIVASFLAARLVGRAPGQAAFMGFLICLSSTAIVLKFLQEHGEVESPHGRTALAILIFQDIAVVPMILFTPMLAGTKESMDQSSLVLLLKGIGLIALVIVGADWIVPAVLYQIARTKSRELFRLSVVAICFAFAWLTSYVGLSLALGAFLAGLIISKSEYSHQALGNILPFRDIFTSFFFVSIGMLLDVSLLFRHPAPIVLTTAGVVLFKSVLGGVAVLLLGFPLRMMVLVGMALSQVGEFSFILSHTGVQCGLLSEEIYQLFLAVTVLTMAATPFVMGAAPFVADFLMRLPLPRRLVNGLYPAPALKSRAETEHLKDHLIIIGFGVGGRNVARAARAARIPYLVLEMNPETVRKEQTKGEPIYYGDAIQDAVLRHAGIADARAVVLTVPDPVATRRVTSIARRMNPKIHIIARTRYLQEMKSLYDLGANEVVPEEFETSVEVFDRVLTKYLVPRDDIERLVAEARADGYGIFGNGSPETALLFGLRPTLSNIEISTLRVGDQSPAAGKSLGQIELRKKWGVTVLAIRRAAQLLSNPDGETPLLANDEVIVLGPPDKVVAAAGLFRNP